MFQIASAMEQQSSVAVEIAQNATRVQSLNHHMGELTESNRSRINTNANQVETMLKGLAVFRC